MKTASLTLFILASTIGVLNAQLASTAITTPVATQPAVVDIGPNHRVWQWQTFESLPNGHYITHNHQYTELASGLNYLNSTGSWVDPQDL